MQTDATLLGPTCCVRLHGTTTMFALVGTCCVQFETGQTFRPIQTDTTLLANNTQECCDLLRSVCMGFNMGCLVIFVVVRSVPRSRNQLYFSQRIAATVNTSSNFSRNFTAVLTIGRMRTLLVSVRSEELRPSLTRSKTLQIAAIAL